LCDLRQQFLALRHRYRFFQILLIEITMSDLRNCSDFRQCSAKKSPTGKQWGLKTPQSLQ